MEGETGKKLAKSTSGLRMVPTSEIFSCPFALEEPMWIPDKEVSKCVACSRTFEFLNRRHHCRRCGKCFCNHCCGHLIFLQRMYFVDPVRHCYDCAVISKAEEEFYSKGVKILMEGATQNVEEEDLANKEHKALGSYNCKLTANHRCIQFSADKAAQNDIGPPAEVLLTNVVGVQMLAEPHSSPGKQTITGMKITYKDKDDASIAHSIILRPTDRKASANWLVYVHKALKMTFESREQKVHG